MSLSYTLYQSRALIPNDAREHNIILKKCQVRNKIADLSGFLYREDNYFVQYLEGEEEAVRATLSRIKKDARHTDYSVVASGKLKERYLPDWQMGFVEQAIIPFSDMLDVTDGTFDLKIADPFDLVVFMVNNADYLRDQQDAA
jgi:hypothetical protein